jgi:hypothetical protein
MRSRLGKPKPIVLKALVDTGSSGTLIAQKFTKHLRIVEDSSKIWKTMEGNFCTTKKTTTQFIIPELHENKVIQHDMYIAKDLGNYDVIIGRDIQLKLGLDVCFSSLEIRWDGAVTSMKNIDTTYEESYYIPDSDVADEAVERIKQILDAKYEPADLDQLVQECTHLNNEQKRSLLSLLKRYKSLFDGTLGHWTGDDYEIELKPDAKPYHARAYPIPKIHEKTLRMEVERLCKIGVLKRVNRSEWAAPTFIIPKKDGTVRFISDFRELNKRIRRKPYPLPKIQDLLLKLEGFQYATSLDLNMGYYHIELSPDSKRLCTIVLPWGKYEYQRLPMGLCNSPDIFQEKMSTLFSDLEYIRAYIDDLLCLTKSDWNDHLDKLEEVFKRLQEAGLKINAHKSFFGRSELEYLGYWITREGIQPVTKKIQAILKLDTPHNKKELRHFLGMINYYRDMWIRRSDILTPLTKLTSKSEKYLWTEEQQKAFELMKRIISRNILLSYPDFTKPIFNWAP